MKSKHLVVDGAVCACNFGASPDILTVLSQQKEYANDADGQKKRIANSLDIGSPFKAGTFGACSKNSGNPCKSSVIQWQGYYEKVQLSNGGFPLTEDSKATCPLGTPGCIRIVFHGQITAMNKPDFLKAKPMVTKALNPAVKIAEILESPSPESSSEDPEFTKISWQDTNLNDIGDRRVEYLDDIYLSVRTENILPGDWLSAKIMEKELIQGDRSVGRTLYAEVDEAGVARFKVSAELLKRFAEKLNALDLINETTHQYYAEISYDGGKISDGNRKQKPIKEKSEVLKITNVAGQAIPPQNGVKPVVVMVDNPGKKKLNKVELKLNIFFDGTKNNRENVKLQEELGKKGAARTKEEEKRYQKHAKETDDSSYSQGYSNVALLQWCDAADKDKREISIYIEGIGTKDGEGDSMKGMAVDWGDTNIKAKAGKAINRILERIKDEKIVNEKKEYVVKAEVNVIGFSRGAAASRHFVSRKSEIAVNALTSKKKVIFTFVGLFDTVSAHGLPDHSKGDDVEKLKLAIGSKAKKVLQLTARDEYRANFCLTNIQSSITAGVGFEYEMPGAHSDIGGGFRNPITENISSPPRGLVDQLIKEGWYTEEQKDTIPAHNEYVASPTGGASFYCKEYCKAERAVFNAYQYIPMEIMANFAKKYGKMVFKEKELDIHYKKIPPDLSEVRRRFVGEASAEDSAAHVEATTDGLDIKKLRNKYLHLTATERNLKAAPSIVNGGRYDKNGNPDRANLDG